MIDKSKIENDFFYEFRHYLYPKYEKVQVLSPKIRQDLINKVKGYYKYLIDSNISYGKIALEVVNNEGKYGLMANSHLKHQCVFDGIKAEKIPEIREQLIISLAYHDMMMRKSQNLDATGDFAKDIEDYHISVFKSLATVYAWGGLAFRELVGTGSWLNLYQQGGSDINALMLIFKNYKESKEYSSQRLLDSIRHTWTHYHELGGLVEPFVDDVAFIPFADAVSKEYLAKVYDVPLNRIIQVDSPQNDTPMVAYNHYKILPASDNPLNHDQLPQVSLEMQALIASYKLPNITGAYRVGYQGINVHTIPLDYGYIDDPSALNQTVRWVLNIHHSATAERNNNNNGSNGVFYISLVSPDKTTFYVSNIEENNNATREITTKSIALTWRQYGTAAEWADRGSQLQKDSNFAIIREKDGRHFIQGLWHALEKPLYFTLVYTKDELLKLGTKSALDLLNTYGSFDTLNEFIDKDLSKELLANRLNIDLDSISDSNYNNSLLKSYTVKVDQQLLEQERMMVITPNTPNQCRIVTIHNKTIVQSLEPLNRDPKDTKVMELLRSLLQAYQWDFTDNILELTTCRNDLQELKAEYNEHQRLLFYALHDYLNNRFNEAPANQKSFDEYLLTSFGEPLNIHMWYVKKIRTCKSLGTTLLGYKINDVTLEGTIFVNNLIQRWNSKLDMLSALPELNISVIPFYEFDTLNSFLDTIYQTFSSLGLQKWGSKGPDKADKLYYSLECGDVTHKNRHHHAERELSSNKHERGLLLSKNDQEHGTNNVMFSSASMNQPIWFSIVNMIKAQIVNFGETVWTSYKSAGNHINIMANSVSIENQKALVLNQVPLLCNDSPAEFVPKNALLNVNINGTLMLTNLVLRMITQEKQEIPYKSFNDQDNITDYAHRLAYSSYAPNFK